MTNLQFALAICSSVVMAMLHTFVQNFWAIFFQVLTMKRFERCNALIAEANAKCAVIMKLNDDQMLIVTEWSNGNDKYVTLCKEIIEKYDKDMAIISNKMSCNIHRITKSAFVDLRNEMASLSEVIGDMDKTIAESSKLAKDQSCNLRV